MLDQILKMMQQSETGKEPRSKFGSMMTIAEELMLLLRATQEELNQCKSKLTALQQQNEQNELALKTLKEEHQKLQIEYDETQNELFVKKASNSDEKDEIDEGDGDLDGMCGC